jgi:hypothetical protein
MANARGEARSNTFRSPDELQNDLIFQVAAFPAYGPRHVAQTAGAAL